MTGCSWHKKLSSLTKRVVKYKDDTTLIDDRKGNILRSLLPMTLRATKRDHSVPYLYDDESMNESRINIREPRFLSLMMTDNICSWDIWTHNVFRNPCNWTNSPWSQLFCDHCIPVVIVLDQDTEKRKFRIRDHDFSCNASFKRTFPAKIREKSKRDVKDDTSFCNSFS